MPDLTPEEVRVLLAFDTVVTVYRKARRGEIPGAYYMGRTLRFHRQTFDDWRSSQIGVSPAPEKAAS